MAWDSRNLLQTWFDTASNSDCLHVFYCSFAQTVLFFTKKLLKCMPSVAQVFLKLWHAFLHFFSVFWAKLQRQLDEKCYFIYDPQLRDDRKLPKK
jgi:hypothetical protein